MGPPRADAPGPAEEVSLESGNQRLESKQNEGATGHRRKFDDIFIRLDTIHERHRQTHCVSPYKVSQCHLNRHGSALGLVQFSNCDQL